MSADEEGQHRLKFEIGDRVKFVLRSGPSGKERRNGSPDGALTFPVSPNRLLESAQISWELAWCEATICRGKQMLPFL
jgi:hypothetical protein